MVTIDRMKWYIRLSPSSLWEVPDAAGVGFGASYSKANQSPTNIRILQACVKLHDQAGKWNSLMY
jgi:hypothetical protein